jgi:hypothetical protein
MFNPDEQEAVSRLAQHTQSVPPPHVADLRAAHPSLSGLHARTVALIVPTAAGERLVIGVAEYTADVNLGPTLRVFVQDASELEFLIAETTFRGPIVSGAAQGCDFLIDLGVSKSTAPVKVVAPARERQS